MTKFHMQIRPTDITVTDPYSDMFMLFNVLHHSRKQQKVN